MPPIYMIENPLVSIIVPVYRVEQYLKRCVNSILDQSYKNLEIILVDDGSPDNCPAVCDEYADRDSRVKVIHKQNGGLSSARNTALDLPPSGDFIFMVDSDDFIHTKTIETLLSIQLQFDADIVQCQYYRGSEDKFPTKYNQDSTPTLMDNISIFYSNSYTVRVWGGLYRSSLWEGVRMPIGLINEDDAVCWKLYYRSKRIVSIKAQFYYYYANPGSIMANLKNSLNLDFIRHYHERIAFFRDNRLELHVQLSQWRYCLPLMMNSVKCRNASNDQLSLMWEEYKKNVGGALRCNYVPITHKVLLILYRSLHRVCRYIGLKIFR